MYKPLTDSEMANILAQLKATGTATDDTPVQLCSQSLPDGVFPDGPIARGDIVTRKSADSWIEQMKEESPNRNYWYEYVEPSQPAPLVPKS